MGTQSGANQPAANPADTVTDTSPASGGPHKAVRETNAMRVNSFKPGPYTAQISKGLYSKRSATTKNLNITVVKGARLDISSLHTSKNGTLWCKTPGGWVSMTDVSPVTSSGSRRRLAYLSRIERFARASEQCIRS